MFYKRLKQINTAKEVQGNSVIYWMSRDQRVKDNHALIAAKKYASERKLQLIVFFNLYTSLGVRLYQHFQFMLDGLEKVARELEDKHICFHIEAGDPDENFSKIKKNYKPAALFFDFSPLREPTDLRNKIAKTTFFPVFVVDTHNIVPVWEASDKEEYAARTIRPKIHGLLNTYLSEPENLDTYRYNKTYLSNFDKCTLLQKVKAQKPDFYNLPFQSGEDEAQKKLRHFIDHKLERYAEDRNEPSLEALSNMSPYIHFGQISSLRITLELKKLKNIKLHKGIQTYLEELIVRKELSDNFCYYNRNYDTFNGLKDWARATLNNHKTDLREHVYSFDEFEKAKTHDPAWNAAQNQLLKTGKIHGYMRMYWAKKVLEWTETPEDAISTAVRLNDMYSIDGYDPNGYVGILWSIGGIHDRGWTERPIFGKVRYMNFNGLKRKFDIKRYIEQWGKF